MTSQHLTATVASASAIESSRQYFTVTEIAYGGEHRQLFVDWYGCPPPDLPFLGIMPDVAERSFRSKPKPSIARADIIAHLVELEERGWDVYRGEEGDTFTVKVNEMQEIEISPPKDTGRCGICTTVAPSLTQSGSVESLAQFEETMDRFFKGRSPQATSRRLHSGEPATNLRRIVRLIGSSKVEGVYDPWLDDEGLGVLLSALRMSKSAAQNLRLITGKKGAKELTPHFVRLVFKELRCTTGLMRRTANPRPHDRLVLLSGGKSIHVGPSWNGMDNEGQISIHRNANDRIFFDGEWATGGPIVSSGPLTALAKKLSG